MKHVDLQKTADELRIGDVVNRHLIDGDIVLFNRQPSLHKMSMMGHRVRVMKGNTFRLNVSVTPPYNADFDGDEMNMHMPQSILAETELKNLAAIPYQMISPANNAPIIGIFQDSMLGSYRFTRSNVNFSPREAMNLLMMFSNVDMKKLRENGDKISNFDIIFSSFSMLALAEPCPNFFLKASAKAFSSSGEIKVSIFPTLQDTLKSLK